MITPKAFGILERLGQTIRTSIAIEVVKIRPATTLLRTRFSTDLCEVLGFVSLTLMTGTQSSLLLQTPPRDLHDFFKKANRGRPTKSHG